MIDFLTNNALYVVLICATIIWVGIAFFLWRVETRITGLEKEVESVRKRES